MTVLGISFAKQILASKGLSKWLKPVAERYANLSGYRKNGLLYDDIIQEESDPVQRALSRLPTSAKYDRAYRTRIATNCSMLHKDLPKDQWVTPEQDKRYLTPLIEDAIAEESERALFDGASVSRPKRH